MWICRTWEKCEECYYVHADKLRVLVCIAPIWISWDNMGYYKSPWITWTDVFVIHKKINCSDESLFSSIEMQLREKTWYPIYWRTFNTLWNSITLQVSFFYLTLTYSFLVLLSVCTCANPCSRRTRGKRRLCLPTVWVLGIELGCQAWW